MTTNGTELGIAGDHIYIVDLATAVLTKVVEAATFLEHVDGFMIALDSATGNKFHEPWLRDIRP